MYMDGLKFLLECVGDSDVQTQYYNLWMCDHYIGMILLFCPDVSCYNGTGTVYDIILPLWERYMEHCQMFILKWGSPLAS